MALAGRCPSPRTSASSHSFACGSGNSNSLCFFLLFYGLYNIVGVQYLSCRSGKRGNGLRGQLLIDVFVNRPRLKFANHLGRLPVLLLADFDRIHLGDAVVELPEYGGPQCVEVYVRVLLNHLRLGGLPDSLCLQNQRSHQLHLAELAEPRELVNDHVHLIAIRRPALLLVDRDHLDRLRDFAQRPEFERDGLELFIRLKGLQLHVRVRKEAVQTV